MVKKNACVFISGFGSNLKSLIQKSRDPGFPVNIRLIVSNNANAKGIFHAKKNSIPYLIVNTKKRDYENMIFKEIKRNKISIICLAGYMKIISKKFIKQVNKKIINIHPSLLPKFKGLHTFKRILNNNEKITGCTVHYVNYRLDSGKIIMQKKVKIRRNDTPNSLSKSRTLLSDNIETSNLFISQSISALVFCLI